MKNTILLLFLLTGFRLSAQTPDAGRMNRDIEVAENVLAALFQEEHVQAAYSRTALISSAVGAVEGTYLEGFGALFTLSARNRALVVAGTYLKPTIAGRGEREVVVSGRGEREVVVIQDAKDKESKSVKEEKADTLSMEKFFRDVSTRFLVDYAFMLRQLPDHEKIMIRFGGGYSPGFGSVRKLALYLDRGEGGQNYSATVKKADVNALQAGTITREQFEKRIEFTSRQDKPDEADRDLVLLSDILSRLYQRDMSEIFWMNGSPNFEKIPGLGAVYYLSLGSRNFRYARASRNVLEPVRAEGFSTTSPKKEEESEEDLIKKLDDAYPEFLEDMKRNIVEYGSIVKNLAPGEALVFQVTLFDCDNCKRMPEKVDITVRQPTLEGYRKGKISLEAATLQLEAVEQQQD